MRRYTGQKALYEAWSLSRSKPKRHGLLERLRPQLERLQAAANAKLKAALPPRNPGAAMESAPREPSKAEVSDYSHLRQAAPPRVEAPKAEVIVSAPKHEEAPPAARGQVRPREGGATAKPKGKTPKAQASQRNAVQTREPEAPKTEVQKVGLPRVEAPKVELPKVESPEIEATEVELPKIESVKVEMPELPVEEAEPIPAAVVPEFAKQADEPPAAWADDYSPLGHEAAVLPRKVERPISRLEAVTGLSAKAGRVVDRLKAYRTQRAEQVELNRSAKPHLATSFRPRMLQINAGRIEVSVPTLYGILAAMATCLVVLVMFKLGQFSGRAQARLDQQNGTQGTVVMTKTNPAGSTVVSQGNNRIVIARHADVNQLAPLVRYFKDHDVRVGTIAVSYLRQILTDRGLSTSAVQGEGYLMMTADMYNNPDNPGTDGYNAKQKIIELGAKYKPPTGYDSFSPETFKKAYGLKVQ